MDHLRRQILSGDLAPGSMLPGERELSEALGVSRLTLRSALAGLQAEGLVEKVHGAGNRVLSFREHGGIETAAHLARYAIEGGDVPLQLLGDILEFRRFVAVQVLSAVAERATPEELLGLRRHVESLHEVADDAARFMEEDLHFARLLVRATHNLALELMYNTALRVLHASPGFEAAFGVNAQETIRVYEALTVLLAGRDPARVRAAAIQVLEPLDRRTLDSLVADHAVTTGAVPRSQAAGAEVVPLSARATGPKPHAGIGDVAQTRKERVAKNAKGDEQ